MCVTAGSNGKTMLEKFIRQCFGDYACTVTANVLSSRRVDPGKPNPELMSLKNKRIAFFNEIEESTTINSAIIKELTGMDEVAYRGLYDSNLSKFVMTCIPVLLCNNKPEVQDRTNAIWRRIRTIPFTANFTMTPDPKNPKDRLAMDNIPVKIMEWKNFFSTFLIEVMYKEFEVDGEDYCIPDSVMNSTKGYKEDTDIVKEWFEEEMVMTNKKEDCVVWSQCWVAFYRWFQNHHPGEVVFKKKIVKPQMERVYGQSCTARLNPVTKKTFLGWMGFRHKNAFLG